MSRGGNTPCADYAESKLSIEDVLVTESVSVVQAYTLFAYPKNVFAEPPLESCVAGGGKTTCRSWHTT